MDWKKYAWLRRGRRRVEIMRIFYNARGPLTVKDVRMRSRIAISQASATVAELYEAALIECLNPKDKIGRLYTTSAEGREIVSQLETAGPDS